MYITIDNWKWFESYMMIVISVHFWPLLETDEKPVNLTFLYLDPSVSWWPFADQKILSLKHSMFPVTSAVCAN